MHIMDLHINLADTIVVKGKGKVAYGEHCFSFPRSFHECSG